MNGAQGAGNSQSANRRSDVNEYLPASETQDSQVK